MKTLQFKRTPEKLALIKALATSAKAREVFASELVGPVVQQVLDQEATHRMLYTPFQYNFGDAPEIPLDYFDANEEGLFNIWASSIPGGLPTNHVTGADQFRMTTMRMDTAFSMLRAHAESGRLDVVSQTINRAAQELLVKEKHYAWAVALTALASVATPANQIIDATTINVFQVDDLNRLKTLTKRLRTSFIGGTPTTVNAKGLTHLVVSPEIMEQVRGWSYQPVNTRSGAVTTSGATSIPLPDQIRQQIWDNAGLPEIWGVGFIELVEMGVGGAYGAIFDAAYSGTPAYNNAADELVLGVDLSVAASVQLTATDSDTGNSVVFEDDDQWSKRSGKVGWFGGYETGFANVDSKVFTGLVV